MSYWPLFFILLKRPKKTFKMNNYYFYILNTRKSKKLLFKY